MNDQAVVLMHEHHDALYRLCDLRHQVLRVLTMSEA